MSTPTTPGYYSYDAGQNGREKVEKVWVGYYNNTIDLWLWRPTAEGQKPLMPVKQVHPSRWRGFLSLFGDLGSTVLPPHEELHHKRAGTESTLVENTVASLSPEEVRDLPRKVTLSTPGIGISVDEMETGPKEKISPGVHPREIDFQPTPLSPEETDDIPLIKGLLESFGPGAKAYLTSPPVNSATAARASLEDFQRLAAERLRRFEAAWVEEMAEKFRVMFRPPRGCTTHDVRAALGELEGVELAGSRDIEPGVIEIVLIGEHIDPQAVADCLRGVLPLGIGTVGRVSCGVYNWTEFPDKKAFFEYYSKALKE